METTIFLVRHGQTDSNAAARFQGWSDVEINENGCFQARKAAERLSANAIDAVYTSPLKRTAKTAAFIAAGHGLNPVVLPDLAEINYGDWEGKSRQEVGERWPELLWKMRNDPSGVAIPGGETFTGFSERCNQTFWQIVEEQVGKQVVVVTHSGVIKAILVAILGGVTANWGKLDIDNASITTIKICGKALHVTSFNNTTHLATLKKGGQKAGERGPAPRFSTDLAPALAA
jgi:broad specificity phosphatase PhoE